MSLRYPSVISAVVSLATAASTLNAAVTTIAYWRMGEGDTGAVAGASAAATTDQTGNFNLTGSAVYSSDTKSGLGSTLSMHFNGNGLLKYTAPVTNVTDNFGYEGWVKFGDLSKSSTFINNGTTTGYGLLQSSGLIYAIFNGTLVLPGIWPPAGGYAANTTDWVHFAVVRDNGVTTYYVNGVVYGTTTTTAPKAPNDGTTPNFTIGSGFVGNIDEVRVFTFESGKFQVSDLLLNSVPEPASLGLAGTTAAFLLLRPRTR